MPPWVIGQLHMAYAWQVLRNGGRQFAFHALGVVNVVLQERIVCVHLVQNR